VGAEPAGTTESRPRPQLGILAHTHTREDKDFITLLNQLETAEFEKLRSELERETIWVATTRAHRQRVVRFSPFAVMQHRPRIFSTIAEEMDWDPKTTNTYWGCVLAAMRIAGRAASVEDVALGKRLHQQAQLAPSWSFEDEVAFLQQHQIDAIIGMATQAFQMRRMHYILPAFIALMWGQRVGDVLKLRASMVYKVDQHVSVCFVEGKTVPKRGQYSMHAPAESLLGQVLVWCSTSATNMYMFAHDDADIKRWERGIHISTPFEFDLRALRRTGLVRFAMAGMSQTQLLEVSRHASVQMLNIYLGRGMFNIEAARSQVTALAMLDSLRPSIQQVNPQWS